MHTQQKSLNVSARRGFTLVEMVVVVLIMGIIAAVAMPRMTASTQTAKINSAKQSLSTIRNALEMYRVENGGNPANAGFANAMKPYLKGPFPPAPYGANAGSTDIAIGTDPPSVVSGASGWAYNPTTGDFYLNDAAALNW